ncbi:MAG: glycosyltransferase family 4 protein [Burkholderiales bacterium]|nr:glycosyltransferase family 4 protein [Burkholderiales bacterium]
MAARLSLRVGILLDHPNARSLHRRTTPRIGGIAFLVAVVVTMIASGRGMPFALSLAVLAVVMISLLDDWRAQPIALRLAVHAVSAVVAVAGLLPGNWAVPLLAVLVVWSANLFNFMDGADGLAASMALIGFSMLGWAGWGSGHEAGSISLILAGAVAGFLLFNLPPARVFMGDAGSIPLGFGAALISIWGVRDGLWPAWFPVLVFLPFLLDASFTLLRRVWRGERFWMAHREHLYQRLVLAGWTHRRLLTVAVPLMLLTGMTACWLLKLPITVQFPVSVLLCLCSATLYSIAHRRLARSTE